MRLLLAALVGLLSSSTALAGHHVRPGQVVVVQAAPPPPVAVVHARPLFRPGFVWVEGYWVGRTYVPGHWERVRPGVALNVAVGPVAVTVVR